MVKDSPIWRAMMENTSVTLAEYAEQEGNNELAIKLRRRHNIVYDQICDKWARNENDFNVICHGDMWSNNFLYKHDEDGEVIDALLCDFQVILYNKPIMDIGHVLFSSSDERLRDADWDRVIQRYHEVLIDTLIKLGYAEPMPSLTDLHVDFLRKSTIDAYMAPVMVGIRKLDEHTEDLMGNFMSNKGENRAFRLAMLSKPQCKNSIDFLLDFAFRKGLFD